MEPLKAPAAAAAPEGGLSRRRLFAAGAGTAGALAAAAVLRPRGAAPAPAAALAAAATGPEAAAEGYRLSDHIQRYYRTTRL
ncbi:MAG: formate dehydrogenase [Burkholderiales bacterium]|nr:formate dehydrogenase [Burkholderiales bacterium]